MRDREWLGKLKVGDKVIWSNRYHQYVKLVDRITKTQIIIAGNVGGRFRKSDGDLIGDTSIWSSTHIEEATPGRIEAILNEERRERYLSIINNCDFELKTDSELSAISDLCKESQ